MIRLCRAYGCCSSVTKEKMFCARHWAMVPRHVKYMLVEFYLIGQAKDDKFFPSAAWRMWFDEAKSAIRTIEAQLVI